MEKGLISAFTSESNDLLKNGSNEEMIDIITERLKYLDAVGMHEDFRY